VLLIALLALAQPTPVPSSRRLKSKRPSGGVSSIHVLTKEKQARDFVLSVASKLWQ
jgi:hypothetical protein